MKNLLTIQDLTTGYRINSRKTKVLHEHLSATVSQGEWIAVLGPNGVGKSTLLKTLLGFIPAISGSIFYGYEKLEDISIKKLATKVAVVLTDKIDDSYLTAEEVIISALYPYSSLWRKPTEEDISKVEEAVALTGVQVLLSQPLHKLSDGERQKVMITRALAQDTPLLFLDEPTSFIDSPGRVELMNLLKKIAGKGKGIVTTIHDVELALHYADNLWLMGKDGTFETGSPDELINNGSINKLFDRGKVTFNNKTNRFF